MHDMRNSFTSQLLMEAGIREGMRVLDVGCGFGEVTMLIADIVGSEGEVAGFDINETSIKTAQETARKKLKANAQFLLADINNLPQDLEPFDAMVGRRVLMYLPDVIASLKSLLPLLKAGGIMAFQESDSLGAGISNNEWPLHTKAQAWIWNTISRENGNIKMGSTMYSAFVKVGLKVQYIKAEPVLQTVATGSDLGMVIKMMLPRIIEAGVATAEEIQIDTLEERLTRERQEVDTLFIRDMVFGIYAVK